MFSELSWLLPTPPDFRKRLATIRRDLSDGHDPGRAWTDLLALGSRALDAIQLGQLATLASRLPQSSDVPAPHVMAVLGHGTLTFAAQALAGSAIRYGLRLDIREGEYGMAVNEALDQDSAVHRAEPDFALIACDRRELGLTRAQPSVEDARARVDAAFDTITTIVGHLRRSVRRQILVQTVAPPMDSLFGSYDLSSIASPYAQVLSLNARLVEWASREGVVLVDVARLAASVGLERWEDRRQWHASKLPFAFEFLPIHADIVARTLGATLGKARKCLVLDLDNTLWGGVIGDDGVGGIVLGQGSAAGEAFLAIQAMALDLRSRGIVLAVCSKNEEVAARLPFQSHDEMLLREEHIAVFQANWVDKAANLRAIAGTLNLGLDALVFLDDNPVEREQVRQELPMVAVPELPADPALYPATLMAAGYFEAVSFGEEDRMRALDYQAGAERRALEATASDIGEYLRSLRMTCDLRPFDVKGRARIAQLINKSNQFNLTTRRYTESQVASLEDDPDAFTLQVSLTDRFNNNGMISVVIARRGQDAWTLDTWLMSCRVLGRRVEEAVLGVLVGAARDAGAARLIGHYVPSAKNAMVAEHYAKLGFSRVGDLPDGGTIWELDVATYETPTLPMTLANATEAAPEKAVA